MDPSSLLRHQEIMESESLESMLVCTNNQGQKKQQQEKKPRPTEEAVKCPRCDSTNTKFCYYNNYSLSQPRYFCKSCKRYWTQGGTLRNIPVGGGCRKNRRTATSCSSSSSSSRVRGTTPDHHQFLLHNNNNNNPNYESINSLLGLHSSNPSENYCNPHFALDGSSVNNPNLGFGNMDNVEGNSVNYCMGMQFENNQEMMMMMLMSNNSSTQTRGGIKHELGENRLLWGIPNWQINGGGGSGGNYMNVDHDNHGSDLIREIGWSNGHVLGSSLHNLINSPLI